MRGRLLLLLLVVLMGRLLSARNRDTGGGPSWCACEGCAEGMGHKEGRRRQWSKAVVVGYVADRAAWCIRQGDGSGSGPASGA